MKLSENFAFSSLSTLGLGGKIRFKAECNSADSVLEALMFAKKKGLPYFILGSASNIIPADQDLEALAIQVSISGMQVVGRTDDGALIYRVGAGESWDAFVLKTIEESCVGLETMSGIPGSVGATPIQNVGAYGRDCSESILQVETISPNGSQQVFQNKDCHFSYRDSRFKSGDAQDKIILRVHYQCSTEKEISIKYPELQEAMDKSLAADSRTLNDLNRKELLLRIRKEVLALRKKKSMLVDSADLESKSLGSFFVNPILEEPELEKTKVLAERLGKKLVFFELDGKSQTKVPAAWLVENAGFPKGFTKNGIGISKSHALALVNRGGSAKDLFEFSEEVIDKVQEVFGITLEREPIPLKDCLRTV